MMANGYSAICFAHASTQAVSLEAAQADIQQATVETARRKAAQAALGSDTQRFDSGDRMMKQEFRTDVVVAGIDCARFSSKEDSVDAVEHAVTMAFRGAGLILHGPPAVDYVGCRDEPAVANAPARVSLEFAVFVLAPPGQEVDLGVFRDLTHDADHLDTLTKLVNSSQFLRGIGVDKSATVLTEPTVQRAFAPAWTAAVRKTLFIDARADESAAEVASACAHAVYAARLGDHRAVEDSAAAAEYCAKAAGGTTSEAVAAAVGGAVAAFGGFDENNTSPEHALALQRVAINAAASAVTLYGDPVDAGVAAAHALSSYLPYEDAAIAAAEVASQMVWNAGGSSDEGTRLAGQAIVRSARSRGYSEVNAARVAGYAVAMVAMKSSDECPPAFNVTRAAVSVMFESGASLTQSGWATICELAGDIASVVALASIHSLPGNALPVPAAVLPLGKMLANSTEHYAVMAATHAARQLKATEAPMLQVTLGACDAAMAITVVSMSVPDLAWKEMSSICMKAVAAAAHAKGSDEAEVLAAAAGAATTEAAEAELTKMPTFDCYDYMVGIENKWSADKLNWCCKFNKAACPLETANSTKVRNIPNPLNFDCAAGFDSWEDGWSLMKKDFCCKATGTGCVKSLNL